MWLVLLGSGPVYANPQLGDEQSLSNGALLYSVYCSDCHGSVQSDQSQALDDADNPDDYTALIDIALGAKAPPKTAVPEDWPEWADPPDPDEIEVVVPNVRAEILDVVTAVIDEAHGIKPASGGSEIVDGSDERNAKNSRKGRFAPTPGTTDLAAPQTFFYGTSEEELFHSIASGTGAAMPGWHAELGSDNAVWDVVNYIRSFWGEEWLY